ncbi:hypothetical protein [Halpernia frigidisoli]|uniref:Signal peptidase n=1 Tax=Halpernia frigidisoli TaxID=1125876 RepID=A0A1I3HVS2_9FLAO|nr:hypothetical protein [Halpernia frigidisoli]SFI39781.1 hypothetical protein SAMN05443292_2416 [Halpernia frigidisoli]
MKKNLKHITASFILFVFSALLNLVNAQQLPPPDPTGRGVGPGAPATPIDMYQIALFAVAVILIGFFYKKLKLNKA